MQIIPVIDIKGGVVVHAVRGQRELYRPVESRFATSSRPGDVARALANMSFEDVYVADLDAIEGGKLNASAIKAIVATGLKVWLDAGSVKLSNTLEHEVATVVGLESLASLKMLAELLASVGSGSLIFISLDHSNGAPIAQIPDWQHATIADIAREVADRGVRRFIDLDLSRVGARNGPQGRGVVAEVRAVARDAFIAIGGGVRSMDDVHALAELGYDAVLVATALHDGSITADDVRGFTRRGAANPSRGRVSREMP